MICKAVLLLAILSSAALAQPPETPDQESANSARERLQDLIERVQPLARQGRGTPEATASSPIPTASSPLPTASPLFASAPDTLPEEAPAPAPAPEAELSSTARKLLGVLTINVTQGDLRTRQIKVGTRQQVQYDEETGQKKVSTAFAFGSATGVNSWDCTKMDCDKPTAQVELDFTNGGATTGIQSTADARATGSFMTRARTNTGSLDAAKNWQGGAAAVSTFRGSSSSTQFHGDIATASSSGQANAFASNAGVAVTTQDGFATAGPTPNGAYGHKDTSVDVRGWSWVAPERQERDWLAHTSGN